MTDVWTEQDLPVLRWVASGTYGGQWTFTMRPEPPPSGIVDGLDDQQVHESLRRLHSDGLIDGQQTGTSHLEIWTRLRVTARGLMVLGDWPDLDQVRSAAAIRSLLRHLADGAPEDERESLRRAGGLVARMGDAVAGAVDELTAGAAREALE